MWTRIDVLARSEVFGNTPPDAIRELSERVTEVELAGGEYLAREGESADAMYVVATGRLIAVRQSPDGPHAGRKTAGIEHGEIILGEIGPGATVGETSLITGETRSADIRAVRDSVLLRIEVDVFHRFISSSPRAAFEMTRVIVERSRSQPRRFDPLSTLCLLPAFSGGSSRNLREVASSLEAAFHTIGPTITIDEGSVASMNDDQGIRRYLDELEEEYRFVIFCAHEDYDEWSRRCMRQADRLLLVSEKPSAITHEQVTPVVSALAERLDRYRAKRELLVVHDDPPPWSGSEEILERLPLYVLHHACRGRPRDFRRIARMLSDQAVGLALGGGGTRGIAHLGVVRALAEEGVEVDTFAGTSAGAIGAVLLAMDLPVNDVRSAVIEIAEQVQSRRDMGPPIAAVFSGRRATAVMKRVFGEQRFEDLPRHAVALSTSLVTGDAVVHRRGPLWWALRASMSLPGAWPAVSYAGDLLVDGGLVNNIPIDVIHHRCRDGVLMASVVGGGQNYSDYITRDQSWVSGWRLLGRRLFGGARSYRRGPVRERRFTSGDARGSRDAGSSADAPVPGLLEVMSRSSTLHSSYRERETLALADLLFRPPLTDYPLLSSDEASFNELERLGYETARRKLEDFRKRRRHGGSL